MTSATAQTIDTADGPFTIVENDEGAVIASGWTDDVGALLARVHPALRPDTVDEGTTAASTATALFYSGDVSAIDSVPVAHRGTEFQLLGREALRRIRPGSPLTYSEFAETLGNPRAVRAAASVCAGNPVALFVPCHRVLRTDGSMGGFAWGIEVKRSLLARESQAA